MNLFIFAAITASLAQLVEQLIRNEQVVGSSPIGGSGDSGLPTSDFRLPTSDFRLPTSDLVISQYQAVR
jgi:hypothetical protein